MHQDSGGSDFKEVNRASKRSRDTEVLNAACRRILLRQILERTYVGEITKGSESDNAALKDES